MQRYRAISEYGLLGDARTAALVAPGGSLDWWCVPRFDAGSVFARLLDSELGGRFSISPPERAAVRMEYEDGTNVLRHRFRVGDGEASLADALAWPAPADAPGSVLLRLLEGLEGRVPIDVHFEPRPEYGEAAAVLAPRDDGVDVTWPGGALLLRTRAPLSVDDAAARAQIELSAGDRLAFVVTHAARPDSPAVEPEAVDALLDSTRQAWRAWDARTTYRGPYREAVRRSALALRLLYYEPTGAIVAAPTTSLPESVGGVRNWDYRFSWPRDGAFAVDALLRTGHPKYVENYVRWLLTAAARTRPVLRSIYSVDGAEDMPERELAHFEGYRRSAPVRVGNAACSQHQLDVYGEVLNAVARRQEEGEPLPPELLAGLADFVDHVARVWREPDSGIWEPRSPERHYVLSKVMAWVALDRALALDLPGDRERWTREREAVREAVLSRGWSEELGSFQMAFDFPHLDASLLLLPLVGFLPADDPRMVATVERIRRDLETDAGLLLRYLDVDDGLPGGEGAFAYCTFWLVNNLALQGRLEEARTLFERMLARASPYGLFSEEMHPATGELLGNYPQALPHIGLIESAVLLEALDRPQASAREVRR
ncbi:MAG TPA: glycoside hydrolase family 15 protein [Candidatus Thermoplasmatota archaeon]|nr:glycoside hydrolase family 15 protein [Candidatus Thermoplasmatota archaeon]